MKIDLSKESGSQSKPPINGVVSLRIIACEKKTSAAKNPMLAFRWEFVTPVVKVNGEDVSIAGLQAFDNIVFSPNNQRFSLSRLKALNKIAKMPEVLDIDNPVELKPYIGKALRCQVVTKAEVLKDGEGEPVLDDDGNPITDNNYKILKFIGADDENTIPAENVAY